MADNSPFRGIVFCNLGTSKTVLLKFVTTVNIVTPYLSPYGYPNSVPGGQKTVEHKKKVKDTNVLIPWYPISYLMICFFGRGAYGSLPDAEIWWCLRTGGGGVLTSFQEPTSCLPFG